MATITEGRLEFIFPESWKCTKFDDWAFFRNQYSRLSGAAEPCSHCSRNNSIGVKAVDIIAIDDTKCCWYIEVKDYRASARTKIIAIADEIAPQVRDTLAAIFAASVNANVDAEIRLANQALESARFRVVLHLEQPAEQSTLYPRGAISRANVQQQLRKLVKPIDAHPMVLNMDRMEGARWNVRST